MPPAAPLLPQVFWFRLELNCPRIDGLPRPKRRLLDLPDSCRLPATGPLDGREALADVRAAWNPHGLAVAVELCGKVRPIVHDPVLPDGSDGVQLWIDTRDTRDVHRATRFCHRYTASLVPKTSGPPEVKVERRPIHRALADPSKADARAVQARAQALPKGWRLELFLPAAALDGFDPETNRRLGFCYQVIDPDRGDQFLGVGRDFPVAEDPSLWPALVLAD